MKICNIVGTRPQFIKYSMMERKLDGHNNILVHSGQHYDKLLFKIFFDELQINHPNYNIGIGSGNYGWQIGELVKRLYDIIYGVKPDCTIVYGDCNTTYAGAIVSNLCGIPVVHVESGLRCGDWKMVEEFNRIQTDHCSRICFAPTTKAMNNLLKEGLGSRSHLVGDLHYDAYKTFKKTFNDSPILDEFNLSFNKYFLATVHRSETLSDDTKLKSVAEAFNQLDKPVLLVMHPHLKKVLKKVNISYENIIVSDSVGYFDMQRLLSKCFMVLTDSGGLTSEAYYHRKKAVVLRDCFEYGKSTSEAVLVGTDTKNIIEETKKETFFDDKKIIGDGHTSDKIVSIIEESL